MGDEVIEAGFIQPHMRKLTRSNRRNTPQAQRLQGTKTDKKG